MFYFQDDRFYTTLYLGDHEAGHETVTYENTGVVNYNSLYIANSEGDAPLIYDDDLKRYINIRYEHLSINYTIAEG